MGLSSLDCVQCGGWPRKYWINGSKEMIERNKKIWPNSVDGWDYVYYGVYQFCSEKCKAYWINEHGAILTVSAVMGKLEQIEEVG